MKRGPKPILELAPYVPANRHQADLLADSLIDAGVPQLVALSLARRLWLDGETGLPSATRTDYRRHLARLDGPPWHRATAQAGRTLRSDSSVRACRLALAAARGPLAAAA